MICRYTLSVIKNPRLQISIQNKLSPSLLRCYTTTLPITNTLSPSFLPRPQHPHDPAHTAPPSRLRRATKTTTRGEATCNRSPAGRCVANRKNFWERTRERGGVTGVARKSRPRLVSENLGVQGPCGEKRGQWEMCLAQVGVDTSEKEV